MSDVHRARDIDKSIIVPFKPKIIIKNGLSTIKQTQMNYSELIMNEMLTKIASKLGHKVHVVCVSVGRHCASNLPDGPMGDRLSSANRVSLLTSCS